MQTLNWQDAVGMLQAIAKAIITSKPLLTDVDAKIGDGDHGIGMAKGMQKALDKLALLPNDGNVYGVFAAFGKAMLLSMGGASGVIFSSMFLDGAKEQPATEALSAPSFATMMAKGLQSIQARGKASIGDKTMVDALSPAVDAMIAFADDGYATMLRAAEKAAAEGVASTKAMVARFGRAKSLMERAIGFQDAGATSVHIMFAAMADYAESH